MNIRFNISIIFLIISLITLTGCEKLFFDDLSKTSRETFNVEEFNRIKVYDSFNIILKQDTVFKVEIEGPKELMKDFECNVYGDTLQLRDSNIRNRIPNYKIPTAYIHFPKIHRFRMHAPGEIKVDGALELDDFNMVIQRHTGNVNMEIYADYLRIATGANKSTGVYNISGKVQEADFWMRNACKLNAKELKTQKTNIRYNSTSDSYINVMDKLEAELIDASGNVYYKGSPDEIIITEQSGTGRLIPID